MTIQDAFNAAAADYDQLRRTLIPCFDDFYNTAISVINRDQGAPLRVLDLGAGTGLYAGMVQAVYPNAECTLIDLAANMLEQAKHRFESMGKSPIIILDNYVTAPLTGTYDLAISALSIHHLADSEKTHLYQKIYDVLCPGGMLINADQVLGSTPMLEAQYRQHWLTTVRALGITEEQLAAALERMTHDRMSPLAQQLTWLEAAGFQNVDCWYKNFSFAVFGGYRS